ncbi:MAG: transporter substrate-binding domain-containing protein, partial [Betaproteobacteria bacterium]|nr:transporter substrate-binding domain-containing protein [Betaproteobacteria bacterium]
MTAVRFVCAVVAGIALAGCAPREEGTLKKIKDSGSITIGHRDASLPFSYYDDKQQPVGYALDLCLKIADAVRTELKLQKLEVKYQLVTSA